jgi:hypothetical protein
MSWDYYTYQIQPADWVEEIWQCMRIEGEVAELKHKEAEMNARASQMGTRH